MLYTCNVRWLINNEGKWWILKVWNYYFQKYWWQTFLINAVHIVLCNLIFSELEVQGISFFRISLKWSTELIDEWHHATLTDSCCNSSSLTLSSLKKVIAFKLLCFGHIFEKFCLCFTESLCFLKSPLWALSSLLQTLQ